ncbi:methylenetetrahydrofolate reductase C-terminal domain-containing protein [uncultured Friedmanniella sp.]|uniref:methylenetetrahydrofolate reductase C-terminal domain-containing protein n=1 Tax=uncultured Friedmanniella sp. TaxID=335381 RepID=UPI0035CC63AA
MSTSCPKRMVHGPCGGVRPDLSCEMAPRPCAFVDVDEVTAVPAVPAVPPPTLPMVLTDLSAPAADAAALEATARRLAPSCDALLVGDHQDRPDFPPSMLARLIADAGGRPWVTLACRDRNRVVLETELQGIRHDGLATVLCVTGDGRAYDVRPDVTQVFDLEGTRLAGLAASLGLSAAVAETPTAPPVRLRPQRLVRKQQAGAAVAVLNHVRSADDVAAFLTAARALGLTMPVIASVAVYTDERSAAVLTRLPGLEIDPAAVAAVLGAADPVAAGIAAAVSEAENLLAVPGVVGVNLSGMASARGRAYAADVQAEIGLRIRAGEARLSG